MAEQIFEGTWEELAARASEFVGKRLRLIVFEAEPQRQPNVAVLEMMRRIAERNKDRPLTSSENTQRYLRDARDGGMYADTDYT